MNRRTLAGGCLFLAASCSSFRAHGPTVRPSEGVSPARTALARTLGPVRTIEGRLTGGFEYMPLAIHTVEFAGEIYGGMRPVPLSASQEAEARHIARRIAYEHERRPSAQTLGDTALLVLLSGDFYRRRRVITTFEYAAAQEPQNAKILSDLAAASEASGWREHSGRFLALEAAGRAVKLDPSLIEARFNLALALEKYCLFHQARQAWREYLELDPNTGWADEARWHLKELERHSHREAWQRDLGRLAHGKPLLAPFDHGDVAREDILERVLGKWALFHSQGRIAEADRHLDLARRVGELLHDQTIRDTVHAIEVTTARNEGKSLQAAHLAYRRGAQYWRAGRSDLAWPMLKTAAGLSAQSSSPLQHWANSVLAEIACDRADYVLAEALIADIRQRADLVRYPALNGQLFLLQGISHLRQSDLPAAAAVLRPIHMATAGAEVQGAAGLYFLMAGNAKHGPVFRIPGIALRQLSKYPESRHLCLALKYLGRRLSSVSPVAAAYVLAEALDVAEAHTDRSLELGVRLQQCRDQVAGQRAGCDWATLGKQSQAFPDPLVRQRLEMEAAALRCDVAPRQPLQQCVRDMRRVIEYYERHDQTLLADGHRIRAKIYERLGKTKAQEEDLLRAITLSEQAGDPFRSVPLRRTRELFDTLIANSIRRGEKHRALALLERYKSTPLAQQQFEASDGALSMGSCNPRPYSHKEFHDGLPRHLTLVEYEVNGEQIVVWIYRSTGSVKVPLSATRAQIVRELGEPSAAGKPRHINRRMVSPMLFERLIKPLHLWLRPGEHLVFVTDPILDSVNFFSLPHPLTGRALCDEGPIGVISKTHGISFGGNSSRITAMARRALVADQPIAPPLSVHTLTDEVVRRSLAQHTTIVEYGVVGNRLFAWVAKRDGLSFVTISLDCRTLKQRVNRLYRRFSRSRSGIGEEAMERLYRDLFGPLRPYLPATGELVIVPDDFLVRVPFAALRNPLTETFLSDNYAISIAASAGMYLYQSGRPFYSEHGDWSVLAVLNPLSDERPERSALPGPSVEKSTILRLYPRSEVLEGREANSDAASVFGKHLITHFGGHWDPWQRTYDGTLEPGGGVDEAKTRLVVLAACATATDPLGTKEYDFGIAEALLGRGVPAVIASLWEVDDALTSRLLMRFYEHFRDGKSAAQALRAAQLDFRYSDEPALQSPRSWAGFQVYGFGGV